MQHPIPLAVPHQGDHDIGPVEPELCLLRRFLPMVAPSGGPIVITADTSVENLHWLRAAYPAALISAIAPEPLRAKFASRFGARLADDAVYGLARAAPSLSARTVLNRDQALILAGIASITVGALVFQPTLASRLFVGFLSLGFAGGIMFRALLAWFGSTARQATACPVSCDASLPVYTILVPMYGEANVLPRLIRSLLLLDYPHDRLDIKLIVEADDFETAELADAMVDRGPFEVIRVPPGRPRTKPRACNYGFKFARGEFTVIYDAEDRPERDQLRKAVALFRTGPRDIACLQARLNFYNADENWLTRGIMAQTPLAFAP